MLEHFLISLMLEHFLMDNIFSEGPRFDPGLWFYDSWNNIKYYFYCTFFIKCVVAQLVDDWFHKSDVMSSNLPDTIKNVFLAPSELYKCTCRSVCRSVCLSVTFYFFCHNSVNFHARTFKFCMEVDLDNIK